MESRTSQVFKRKQLNDLYMKDKLLVICGPTAMGKSSLAIDMAKIFSGELISADSRQVYKKMDIGTGKDLPVNAKHKTESGGLSGYHIVSGVRIWGYDLINPTEDFSVAHYIKYAKRVIRYILSRGKLPILVGGTGLYIKGVVDGIDTAGIPRNEKLRDNLQKKSVAELFEMLSSLDAFRAAGMNISDKKNPRRLIRAIEIAVSKLKAVSKSNNKGGSYKTLFIGLKADREIIDKRIEKRVKDRLKKGAKKEVRKLLNSGVGWSDQSMSSIGYAQWKGYFEGNDNINSAVKNWIKAEQQYSKRQLTWFGRDKRIKWFEINKPEFGKDVEELIRGWVTENR